MKIAYLLKIKRGTSGLGLFTEQSIPKGRFVIEYWGELLTDEEANRVGGKYLFEIGNGKTVNGVTRKNSARYINHCCKPNCQSRTVGNRVFIYAIESIEAGQELTYDYGKEYVRFYIKPYGCRCRVCLRRK
jgi:SET domain-containing protein